MQKFDIERRGVEGDTLVFHVPGVSSTLRRAAAELGRALGCKIEFEEHPEPRPESFHEGPFGVEIAPDLQEGAGARMAQLLREKAQAEADAHEKVLADEQRAQLEKVRDEAVAAINVEAASSEVTATSATLASVETSPPAQ